MKGLEKEKRGHGEDEGKKIRMYLDSNYVHVHSQFSLICLFLFH